MCQELDLLWAWLFCGWGLFVYDDFLYLSGARAALFCSPLATLCLCSRILGCLYLALHGIAVVERWAADTVMLCCMLESVSQFVLMGDFHGYLFLF